MGRCCFVRSRMLAATSVILGVLWTWQLKAAVESFSVSESPALVNHADRDVQIQQFDSSLGTLQSVTIALQGTGSFSQRFAHFGVPHGQLLVAQNLSLTLETLDDQKLIVVNQAEDHLYSFSGLDGGSAFAGRFGETHDYEVTAAGASTLDSPRDLMEFTGSSYADLILSARGRVGDHFTAGGGLLECLLRAGADITVTYDYTPCPRITAVPEVSTWLAGGFAFLCLAITCWRRQCRNH